MTNVPLSLPEFFRRLWQYWVVVCASRQGVSFARSPDEERVAEILRCLWTVRDQIDRGEIVGITYREDIGVLRITRQGLRAIVPDSEGGETREHPYRVFYGRQFGGRIRRFADEGMYKGWRNKRRPNLSGVEDLVKFGREFPEGGIDASRDLTFVGTLVQVPAGTATTAIGFMELGSGLAFAYAKGRTTPQLLPASAPSKKTSSGEALRRRVSSLRVNALRVLRILALLDFLEQRPSRRTIERIFAHLCQEEPGTHLADGIEELVDAEVIVATRSELTATSGVLDVMMPKLVRGHFSLPDITGRFDDIANAITEISDAFDDPDDVLLRLVLLYEQAGRYDRALAAAKRGRSTAARQAKAVLLARTGKYRDAFDEFVTLPDDPAFAYRFVRAFVPGRATRHLVRLALAGDPNLRARVRAACDQARMREEVRALS